MVYEKHVLIGQLMLLLTVLASHTFKALKLPPLFLCIKCQSPRFWWRALKNWFYTTSKTTSSPAGTVTSIYLKKNKKIKKDISASLTSVFTHFEKNTPTNLLQWLTWSFIIMNTPAVVCFWFDPISTFLVQKHSLILLFHTTLKTWTACV